MPFTNNLKVRLYTYNWEVEHLVLDLGLFQRTLETNNQTIPRMKLRPTIKTYSKRTKASISCWKVCHAREFPGFFSKHQTALTMKHLIHFLSLFNKPCMYQYKYLIYRAEHVYPQTLALFGRIEPHLDQLQLFLTSCVLENHLILFNPIKKCRIHIRNHIRNLP